MQSGDELSASIIEAMWQPLVVLDGALRIRFANRSFYRTFRVRRKEIEGKLLYDLEGRSWDVPQLLRLLEATAIGKCDLQSYTVERIFPGIGQRAILLNARRLRQRGCQPALILVCMEDVTIRKRSEDMRQLLLAATSHDGLNVLNNITGYAQLLEDCDSEHVVPRILSLSMALGEIMRDMVDHVDAANDRPNLAVVSARTLIGERAEAVEWQCRQKGLELRVDLPEEGPVTTDSSKVTRILDNLLSNSVRYTLNGRVHLQGRLLHRKLSVRVSDTGIGIPADHLRRVFEPHYRAPTAREIAPLGTGLGLFTVKRFSELLGGNARIRSAPGIGTTCTVTLPRHPQAT